MTDFWRNSGFHLVKRDARGHLALTDDFLRAYWNRPEVRPIEESCAAERALHARLLEQPRAAVGDAELAALADPDAVESYRIVAAFRERLIAADTLEAAYLDYFRRPPKRSAGEVPVPPLFLDQLAHVILRAILEGERDALRARAGEFFFREQKVTINDGHIMAGDAEVVEHYATTGGFGDLGRLIADAQTPLRTLELDVLDGSNAALYWTRDEAHDTVLNLNFAGDGLDALCRVLERWVKHFLDVDVSIQPVQKISDERWVWHIGLDAEASALLNDLYDGQKVGEARLARLLSLFRMDFADPQRMRPDIAGRPIYLALAMTESGQLKLKPQNLLVSLPLATQA